MEGYELTDFTLWLVDYYMLFVIVFIVALRTKETYDPIQNMSSFSVASTWFFPDFTRVLIVDLGSYVHEDVRSFPFDLSWIRHGRTSS